MPPSLLVQFLTYLICGPDARQGSQKQRKEKFSQLLKTYYLLQQREDRNLQNN